MHSPVTFIPAALLIPYYAQVASPELAGEFFDRGRPLESDPRWAESGAATPEEYAYWADRACGIACVKMCIEALGGPVRTIQAWVQAGLEYEGYLVERLPDGQVIEHGWVHRCLAKLIEPYARRCWCEAGDLESMAAHLAAGRLVIASVSYEIGTSGPISRQGGHLVVLTGVEQQAAAITALRLHNPSGRTAELRIDARIPVERFAAGFKGRFIVVQPN